MFRLGGIISTGVGTSTGGWTIVNPVTPTQAPSGSGAGSRLIYVSSSTGSDGNAGTISAPFATIQHACLSLRDGFSDQLFLACGDTWTLSSSDTGFLDNVPRGASAGPVRNINNFNMTLVTSGPILIGSYQRPGTTLTARPVVQVSTALSTPIGIGAKFTSTAFDKVIVQGLEFYAYKRDPNNASYAYSEAVSTVTGCFSQQTVTYVLLEDCLFHWFTDNNVGFQTTNNMPSNAINLNRCIVTDSYAGGNGGGGNGNSQGLFANVAGATGGYNANVMNMTGCCFDQCGWNKSLTTPANASFSGNVFTWPTTLKFGNTANVVVLSAGGSSLIQGTTYFAVATSGNTFSLASTVGGVALSTAGLPNPCSLVWSDPQASTQNRNFYCDPPYTMINCISSNSSAEGFNARQGGSFLKNLLVRNTGHAIGDFVDGFSQISQFEFGYNVILSAMDVQSIPTQTRGGGVEVFNCVATGTNGTIHDNIIANWSASGNAASIELDDSSGAGGVGGVQTNNNIIWGTGSGTGTGYQDDPGNASHGLINTISGNTFDSTKANNLPSPEPFTTALANQTIGDYNASIGGAGGSTGEAQFIAGARANSRLGGWNLAYTANPPLNYFRNNFKQGPV